MSRSSQEGPGHNCVTSGAISQCDTELEGGLQRAPEACEAFFREAAIASLGVKMPATCKVQSSP